MNNQRPAPPKKTAIDEWKIRLSGEQLNGGNKKPTLAFSVVKNQVRINVKTNVEGDKEYGLIRAAMDSPTFFALLVELQNAIDAPGEYKAYIKNQNYTFYQGKRSESPTLVSTTILGKDANGRVYLTVTAKDRPKPIFYFASTFFHSVLKADGSSYTEAEDSVLYAKAFVTLLTGLTPAVLANEYIEPDTSNFGNNNGGYNNNNNNNGGNNNQSSSAPAPGGKTDFDDDLPF